MIKVSDYVVQFLVDHGIRDIFLVSGGGIMHLLDSVGRNPQMAYYCNYHEQACAIAAESYARVRCHVGACLVTTGPGSTNALSGIAGAWVDSIPVLVISGQVRRSLIADYSKLRQFGPQEINIDALARPIVKYFKTITDSMTIRRELECAWWQATSDRPGPVWINIPLDVQGELFDEQCAPGFVPPPRDATKEAHISEKVAEVIRRFQAAERPLVIAGNGIHLSRAHDSFRSFINKVNTPVLLTVGAPDLLDEDDPQNMGRFGPLGQRRANFAVQNADLLICVGASMSVGSIGFNDKAFAPKAARIMVNIDRNESEKPNFKPCLAIVADAEEFFQEFLKQAAGCAFAPSPKWLDVCREWKQAYPTVTPDYLTDSEHVNSYYFARSLSDRLPASAVVVTGNSLDFWSAYQSFRIQAGQRLFTNINYGAMGWDLPAAVGAAVASPRRIVCLSTGDGSLLFNIQELMTIGKYGWPIKIFVHNNQGYEAIRSTQKNFFNGRRVGSDFQSGIGNPSFCDLASAFGLGYVHIARNRDIGSRLTEVFDTEGPVICELNVSPDQARSPKTSTVRRPDGTMESRPLEDMFPFLPQEEVARNMQLFDGED